MISKTDIARVLEAVKIEEVISDYVTLKKRGVNYVALCPFHNEKTPSFHVSPSKNIYKCFGCGEAGNAVNFLMKYEKFTYYEAIKALAKKYNIEITEREKTFEELQIENEQQLLFLIYDLAQKYYASCLKETDEGKNIALPYLRQRGIFDESIRIFGLGYAPENNKLSFVEYALKKGYKKEDLIKAGLALNSKENIDIFRGRIIFPIYSIAGRVIALGGRTMKSQDKGAKYINSQETAIYKKSNVLYGLNLAKTYIAKENFCYLVEGYTDVISLYQAGFKNVVASSGTSLTQEQIQLIKRYTPNITIVYDGDSAGIKASFRGIDMILEQDMDVNVILLPEGEDPDSFVKNNDNDTVNSFFQKNISSFLTFKTNILLKEIDNNPIKKAGVLKDIIQTIAIIPDGIKRYIYIRECARLLNISEEVLSSEIQKIIINKLLKNNFTTKEAKIIKKLTDKNQETHDENIEIQNPLDIIEKRIASLLLNFSDKNVYIEQINEKGESEKFDFLPVKVIIDNLTKDNFLPENENCRAIFDYYAKKTQENLIYSGLQFIQEIKDEKILSFAISLMSSPYTLSENWKNQLGVEVSNVENTSHLLIHEIKETLSIYKLRRLEKMHSILTEKISKEKNVEEQNKLLIQLTKINKAMAELSQIIGATRID